MGSPQIVIVGAGFAGIGMAALLKRARIDTFTILEEAGGVGGAWWHNRYPGAEVDTHSVVYSYPFKPHRWTRSHAGQAEVQDYLEQTLDDYGLRAHLRLNTSVRSATWDEGTHTYGLELGDGAAMTCQVLVAATGFLNIPRYPDWPGLANFRGPAFHSARWQPTDLEGRTVAIVGTGSTASQLVPALSQVAGRVIQFQREPGWIVPKGEHDHSPRERDRLGRWLWYRWERIKMYRFIEKVQFSGGLFRAGDPANDAGRAAALAFIERELGDRPDLQKAVTPDYPYWGKRLILNSIYYAALKRDNVVLVPRAVASVTENGVVDADGVEYAVDVLVFATGFHPTDYLGTLEVRGRGGRTLAESWDGEPRAFLGITVPDFPNLFILYGPGTNGGEIVSMLMRQERHVVRTVRWMRRRRMTAVTVRPAWAARYDAWLQAQVSRTVWAASNNYYRTASGRVVTQWPYSPLRYAAMVRLLGRASQRSSRLRSG